MASRHRVIWSVPGVGQLRCLKKDSSKISFWVESYINGDPKRGPFYVNLQDHRKYVRPTFENFIRRMIHHITGLYESWSSYSEWYKSTSTTQVQLTVRHIELALDYLFAALGRLAEKAVIS
jgi:hypothetical protein